MTDILRCLAICRSLVERFGGAAVVAALWVGTLAVSPGRAQQPRPNIVLIVADDLGYGDLGSYGGKIATPVLDSLAAEGVRLTGFYANAPECTPTRVALLTGRYQHRVGGLETAIGLGGAGRYPDAAILSARHELGLPPSHGVLPGALKARGYRAALVGKWHLGYDSGFQPPAHGFDYAIGPLGGGVDYFHHTEPVGEFLGGTLAGDHDLYRNGVEHHREGYYLTHLITDEAVAWLNQQRPDHPFFLYLPYTAPHEPLQGPDDYRPEKLNSEEWKRRPPGTYAAMIEEMDAGVGRILAKLEEMGAAENTVVIFTSDNGPTSEGSTGPFSGHKGNVYEGGIRVPTIVRWPGRLQPGSVSGQTAITMDLTASILRIAGARPPVERPLDGMDIVRHLEEGRPDRPRTLFWRIRRGENDRRAVREGDLKYLHLRSGTEVEEHLFDLRADPGEEWDVLKKRPAEAERMRRRLTEWQEETTPERPQLRADGWKIASGISCTR